MRGFSGKLAIAAFAAAGVFAVASLAHADSLAESLNSLVQNHKQIKRAEVNLEATKERAKAAWGDWYPTLDVSGTYGREKRNKASGTDDIEEVPRQLSLTVTQQLWDFGSTNAAIRSANLTVDRSRQNLTATRQALVLQGIEAHLNVIRASKVLGFAKGSVGNIRRQAELEDARVQRGSGFTTDVLQAKTQLAGAEARRNNFAGDLRNSINAYRRVFNKEPGKIEDLKEPRIPFEMLPKTLDDLIQAMFDGNPGLKLSKLDADIQRETVLQTRADEFFPTLDAIAETKRNQDFSGTLRNEIEQIFKVELNYSLNLGLTERNTVKASELDLRAATLGYIDARDSFEQQARDLWSNFERDQENAEFLKNQANIAAEFLELARRERQLGNRSLIDVLAGETALINANSDATSTETDVMLDVFRIINIIGQLEADIVGK